MTTQPSTRGRRLIPLEEVAEITGWPLRTLQRQCRAGEIEHVHMGRSRSMTEAQIDALIAKHTVRPAQAATDEMAARVERARARVARRNLRSSA